MTLNIMQCFVKGVFWHCAGFYLPKGQVIYHLDPKQRDFIPNILLIYKRIN